MNRMAIKLLPNRSSLFMDVLKTVSMLLAATLINAGIVRLTGDANNVSEIYILAVLLSSLITNGYFWGLFASLIGVVGTNYFFTYPYYALNFSLRGYPLTFFNMLIVAVVTSTMAAWIKEQMSLSRAREKKTQQVNIINQRLLCTESSEQVGQLAAECLFRFLNRTVRVYYEQSFNDYAQFGSPPENLSVKREEEALLWAFKSRKQGGFGTAFHHDCAFWYIPLLSEERVLAVVGILSREQDRFSEESKKFMQLLLSQFTLALERQRLADERQQIVIEKQREQMRSNLLRAISHDLRTPLTGIIGASSAIIENGARIDETSKSRLINDIHEDAGWLLRMVENVLSVTKLGEQEAHIHKVEEPVEEVVEQAVKRCRKRFPAMRLNVRMPDEFLMIPMDSTLIEQVLINLIENAVRHSGSDSPIDVSVYRDKNSVAIVVRDYGKGISWKDLPTLFDGFSSRDKENTDTTRGLGLGLSICKSIVSAHNGSIWAENPPDGGACFTFILPMEED